MKYTQEDHTFAICAYKESGYLEECIRSLRQQTLRSTIILCAAKNSGFLEKTAEKYNLPLKIRGEEPEISADWNFAYRSAQTPLVTLAHQDDFYEPDFLKKTLKALNKEKRPLIAFTDYFEIRNGGRADPNRSVNLMIKKLMLSPLRLPKMKADRACRRIILSFGCAICCPSVTYAKKNLPEKIFSNGLKVDLDWQAWERISKRKGSFCYIPEVLMGHRIHSSSETFKAVGNSERRSAEDLWMFRKFWPGKTAERLNRLYAAAQKENRIV